MTPEDFFDFFFNNPQNPNSRIPRPKESVQGSGFIYDQQGYVITNDHVVEDADVIKVKLNDGQELEATVVGRDPKTDLALLKLNKEGSYPFITLGDSDKLKIGDWLVAIGNPFGLEHTVTAGILSARGRAIGAGPYDDFLQTDASINPGNSGGPLLNLSGDVVGINSMIRARGTGIGFAIPSKMVIKIIDQLKTKGHVERGWIGVYIQPVTNEMIKSFGLENTNGALIADIIADAPAQKAGFQHGDVVVEFDGQPIKQFGELSALVADTQIGKVVNVAVMRDKKRVNLSLTVARLEDDSVTLAGTGSTGAVDLGLSLKPMTPDMATQMNVEAKGLFVEQISPGSLAFEAGIRPRDIVLEVDRQAVNTVQDYINIINKHPKDEPVLMWVKRGDRTIYQLVPLK
jgi:serine protease Do